jgi:hypothetical protein
MTSCRQRKRVNESGAERCKGCTMTHVNQREANRRAWRAKTWAGVKLQPAAAEG